MTKVKDKYSSNDWNTMPGFHFHICLFCFTESKQPRTPAAKTGREALDNKASLLSETKAVKKCKIKRNNNNKNVL